MFLSEVEAETVLRDLRRRRDAIDRAIADHQLYLELGRRLGAPVPAAGPAPGEPTAPEPASGAKPSPGAEPSPGLEASPGPEASPGTPADLPGALATDRSRAGDDLVAARRHGRALIAAAVNLLHEAGRPLHAGEIWQGLSALGFELPGHDPVAALNTRLWKRSGLGGPLKRLGEAVYAPAEEDDDLGRPASWHGAGRRRPASAALAPRSASIGRPPGSEGGSVEPGPLVLAHQDDHSGRAKTVSWPPRAV